MTRSVILLLLILMCGTFVAAQDSTHVPEFLQFYYDHYPFVTMTDTAFTFESEFVWPEGFHRPDSSEQTPFQNWVSNFPLWHQWTSVGHWKGGKKYNHDEVSRPIHLPWKGSRFNDRSIPLRIWGEWLHYNNRGAELRVLPKKGDTLRYEDFLSGNLVYNNRMEPYFRPTEPREPSEREFFSFLMCCIDHSNYKSIAANCISMKPDEIMPGDLFIAQDEKGRKGSIYVVMLMVLNDKGDKRYVVGCGCEEACDFHIPLLTEDRDKPWLTVDDIEKLTPEYTQRGFYRMPIP